MRLLLVAAACLILACGPSQSAAPARQPASAAPESGATTASAASEAPTSVPAQPVPLRVAYSELTPAQFSNWIAYEHGIYAKHGLDVQLSYIASAQTTTAVIGGDVDVALGGGFAAISSRFAGSDLVIFLGVTTFYPYEFMVTPDVASVADLRGKTLGISRFGSSSDVGTRVALRYLGLDPERDVTYLQVGSLAERFAAMKSGVIAGGLASPPQITPLKRQGFKSLLDLASTGLETLNNTGMASAAWLRTNDATAQAFTNAIIEGFAYARTHREETERVIAQYLKLDDPDEAAEAYDFYAVQHFRRVPVPAEQPVREFLQEQAATDPRAAGARVEDFVDKRFVERAVASGFVDQLYAGQ
ncbi:MAG TPA: ABC transporter substrate-binding protein [Chloroflexota bacterium]|nr:ABC transporter substrate-binding protein [Chloroflexota bacterium]